MSWILFLYGSVIPALIVLLLIGIKGFVEITRYENGKSFYYKLNPLTKIVFGIIVMIVASVTVWWIGAILTLVLLLSYLTLNDGKRKFMYAFYLFLSTVIGGTWSVAPYTTYSVLQLAGLSGNTIIWTWPTYFEFFGYEPYLTLQQLIYGVQVSFRIAAVITASLILILTTTASDLFRMFNKIRVPLPITFALTVAFTTVPKIFDLIDTSVKMQFLRGFGYGKPFFLRPFYLLIAAILAIPPTIIYLARNARNLAISVDTRGFRAYNSRTSLVEIPFTKYDEIMWGVIILLIVLAVLANVLGFGRTIPYTGL
nr:energy-coupling factor transporter transmembrane protein EcfT [Sulfolobus sp. A20]